MRPEWHCLKHSQIRPRLILVFFGWPCILSASRSSDLDFVSKGKDFRHRLTMRGSTLPGRCPTVFSIVSRSNTLRPSRSSWPFECCRHIRHSCKLCLKLNCLGSMSDSDAASAIIIRIRLWANRYIHTSFSIICGVLQLNTPMPSVDLILRKSSSTCQRC